MALPRLAGAALWRPCVVALVFNRHGRVLLGERLDVPNAWQFPQGGSEPGETVLQAAQREMFEEIGLLVGADLQAIGEVGGDAACSYEVQGGWLRHGGYTGQCLSAALFCYSGAADLPAVDLSGLGGEKPEFGSVRWATPLAAVEGCAAFKRDAYREIIQRAQPLMHAHLASKEAGRGDKGS